IHFQACLDMRDVERECFIFVSPPGRLAAQDFEGVGSAGKPTNPAADETQTNHLNDTARTTRRERSSGAD
ncbi:hypothetical protein ACLKMY_23630, partial [Paraburkholderia mimosarum]|uniref:hypothetical protein n=1 Tax=Paraburkholderia mimosarum TaxID=312026 RepID=UPI001C3F14ED